MGSPKGFLYPKMELFSGYVWVFLSKLMQIMFWIFTRIFTRYFAPKVINSACSSNLSREKYQTDSKSESSGEGQGTDTLTNERDETDSNSCEPEASFKNAAGNHGYEEEEPTKLVFKFQYQTWNCSEDLEGSCSNSYDLLNTDTASASTNKYEFISGKSFRHFLDEPVASNFTVKELYVHSNDCSLEDEAINDFLFLSERNLMPENCERRGVYAEILDNCTEKVNVLPSIEQPDSGKDQADNLNSNMLAKEISAADNFLSEDDFIWLEEESGIIFQGSIMSKPEESAKPNSRSSSALDIEDSNMFDTLWEHQDFIEQLKMELKKVRATGLPTIFEDSEFPRIMQGLKPWKIEEKFEHDSTINELPKFYSSYGERMRKLDILNFQKMYAIGSLQSKDPLQLFSSPKNSSPSITSFLPHSFCLSRSKKSEHDPVKKFIRDLYSDLETVYVGQLCLSWEFLRWEYEKALELWESDPYGLRRYNEVAGEFQQFQVLLHRFIENQPFQGPWVESYVRNRCVLRNLLQVPVIREDNTKDYKKFRKEEADEDSITSDMLVEIMEESIRTIWRFIRADKDTSSLTHRGPREIQIQLQDPADSKLLVEIRADLQKKEKRLRELSRSGSCILKKLQKQEEDGTDHLLYFFCAVDMKLVWRVLNMCRLTTDQLAWCRNKLNKINFVNRRIHLEPSFLLFPC